MFGHPGGEWVLRCHVGVTMQPGYEGDILRLTVENTSGANWHGELQYSPFPVLAGAVWHLAFLARAENPFTFSVWLGQQDSPYDSLVSSENHFAEAKMDSNWQTFSHRWVAYRTEARARLNFALGQVDNTVEIKGVRLRAEAV